MITASCRWTNNVVNDAFLRVCLVCSRIFLMKKYICVFADYLPFLHLKMHYSTSFDFLNVAKLGGNLLPIRQWVQWPGKPSAHRLILIIEIEISSGDITSLWFTLPVNKDQTVHWLTADAFLEGKSPQHQKGRPVWWNTSQETSKQSDQHAESHHCFGC